MSGAPERHLVQLLLPLRDRQGAPFPSTRTSSWCARTASSGCEGTCRCGPRDGAVRRLTSRRGRASVARPTAPHARNPSASPLALTIASRVSRLASASLWLLVLGASAACAARTAPREPRFLTPYGPPTYPFSPAVRVGDMLYLAGQLGTDSAGRLVPGGVEAETRQALANIADVLARTGSSMDRVVKCTVMMADMKEWPAMNAVYAQFFRAHFPARSAFGTTGLARDARVEIECLAVARGG